MNREEFWAAIENSAARVTFSRYCISGLVPDCGCQRCMRGRGEVPTFRTELRAARRSRKETAAFHERTRAWLREREMR